MQTPSPLIRALARRSLFVNRASCDPHVDESMVAIEKLRTALSRFAGSEGFTSLLRRALKLASIEVPSLQSVRLGADGCLEGMEKLAAGTDADTPGERGEAAVAIVAYLLGLLATFVGEALMLKLAGQAWPEIPLDKNWTESEADR